MMGWADRIFFTVLILAVGMPEQRYLLMRGILAEWRYQRADKRAKKLEAVADQLAKEEKAERAAANAPYITPAGQGKGQKQKPVQKTPPRVRARLRTRTRAQNAREGGPRLIKSS